jgi:hypothetical protein
MIAKVTEELSLKHMLQPMKQGKFDPSGFYSVEY